MTEENIAETLPTVEAAPEPAPEPATPNRPRRTVAEPVARTSRTDAADPIGP